MYMHLKNKSKYKTLPRIYNADDVEKCLVKRVHTEIDD